MGMTLGIKPRGPMVLIHRLPRNDRRTKHGIQIPDVAKQALFKAEVLAVGEGIPTDAGQSNGLRPINLAPGDIVLVRDDPPISDPRARTMPRNLVPITSTSDNYLVNEGYVYAIDNAIIDDEKENE